MVDIEIYRKHLDEQKVILARLKTELLVTAKDLKDLKAKRDAEPENEAVRAQYIEAAKHLHDVQEYLFNDPEAIAVQREIPQMEAELMELNARFLRELQ